ncbi:MAG: argH [Clostridia bacterium]|nr:argH [Clostridia bacterium]
MGFLNTIEVADYLLLKGMNLRDVHGLVKSITMYCKKRNKTIKDLNLQELTQLSSFFDESIYEYIEYDKKSERN